MRLTWEHIGRVLLDLQRCRTGEGSDFWGVTYEYGAKQLIEQYRMLVSEQPYEALADRSESDWSDYRTGTLWGGRNQHTWFRTRVTIPTAFDGLPVYFALRTGFEGQWDPINPQFLVYIDGQISQGLDINHLEVLLSPKACAGQQYDLLLRGYSGMLDRQSNLFSHLYATPPCLDELYYNLAVPYELIPQLDKDDKRRVDLLALLDHAIGMLDMRQPGSDAFLESARQANSFLAENLYNRPEDPEAIQLSAVGHTHIDVAWLWQLSQTREKVVRSFSTVLKLMEEYPEYVFMSSQPQLYQYLKEEAPGLYERLRQRVAEGRWECEGGMWLEADCNLTSGESLVRQFLYGTRFFQDEFGMENHILWLPDVFGYSAALPQIMLKSGIRYFMTTKVAGNQYNRIPYDTFQWRGIDGSEVLAHFITTQPTAAARAGARWTSYNGQLNPDEAVGGWIRYNNKELGGHILTCYGYGDGGGGPTRKMLEYGRRMKALPGCPRVVFEGSRDFFQKLDNQARGHKRLPTWTGELYFEYHRGTYTSMARNKRYNRKCEFLYQDAELLSSMAHMLAGMEYPKEALDEGWKLILLNQFHDILPGSSIHEVYEESREQYQKALGIGRRIVERALEAVAGKIASAGQAYVVFNTLSFTRSDMIHIPYEGELFALRDEQGRVFPGQCIQLDGHQRLAFVVHDIPAKGYKKLTRTAQPDCESIQVSQGTLHTPRYALTLDDTGAIARLYDKQNNRDVFRPGMPANVLQAFEDRPLEHDAWDIEIFYSDKVYTLPKAQSIELLDCGPVLARLRVTTGFMDSSIVQDIILYNELDRIDIASDIDWKQKQILLKAAFPLDLNAQSATYEIQYGSVQRSSTQNTSWDVARFETVAHKWIDVAEEGYGVSLLNDCKYGHDVTIGQMRITLIKSAVSPNTQADRERHRFIYSIYPHAGSWQQAATVQQAYSLNVPMYVQPILAQAGALSAEGSFVQVDVGHVIVEVVKQAEDGDGWIIRAYEAHNARGPVRMRCMLPLARVDECDLMEHATAPVVLQDQDSFVFEIKPYEIKTFKVQPS